MSTNSKTDGVEPFELTVTGRAEIPHPAERALINISVSSQGKNKAAVSDEVVTTAKHIEGMLRDLSPKDASAEAKAAAALAHWNKTSLSSTSFIPYEYSGSKSRPLPREYTISVAFDIRFKEFKALGAFGTRISSLPHVEISNIDWVLTDTTEKSYRSQLRREAAAEALEKAQDYCDVLGCGNVRPVELNENGRGMSRSRDSRMNVGHLSMQQQMMASQQAATSAVQMQSASGRGSGRDYKEEDLEFRPQEVRMSMEVTVRFQADPIRNGQVMTTTAKRTRNEEKEPASEDYDAGWS